MSSLFETAYNPDVLSCLANLSNDEVFTPPEIANQMLDLLPEELWRDPNAKFLDPACKSGVFLREIAKRLIDGLEDEYPDLDERLEHIFKEQLFGIAITELTSLLSRRSLYCSKYPQSKYSVVEFNNIEGNIRFRNCTHTWIEGRCTACGASQKEYERDESLEQYAYEFIHKNDGIRIFDMKFDVIISNPPYQLSDGSGGSTDSAMPIYQKFIEQAKKLNPRYMSMIVPSKWMSGGRGLSRFREEMKKDKRLRYLYDFEESKSVFPGVHIDGGICYFLWDRDYIGETEYHYTNNAGFSTISSRFLENSFSEYVIRDNNIVSILEKTSTDESFSSIVSNVRPYGIRGYLFNEPDRYPTSGLSDVSFEGSLHVYGVKGIKGGARRVEGYVNRHLATNNIDTIEKFKIFFTTSYSTNAIIPPKSILAKPHDICTETFLVVGPFDSEIEQANCDSYMNTNFFRFLLYHGKGTMHVTSSVFSLIPLQDFSQVWTDQILYEKYGFSDDEIALIESTVCLGGKK